MAKEDKEKTEAETEVAAKKPDNKLIIIFLAAIIVLLVSVGGALFYLLAAKSHAPKQASAKKAEVSQEAEASEEGEKAQKPEKDDKEKEVVRKVAFYPIKPAFVVNIQTPGRPRFLQVEVNIKVENEATIKDLENLLPIIKNDLNQLFSSKQYDELLTPEGKEKLRLEATTKVQEIMKKELGNTDVSDVLFTGFVMQ